ncbi:MAG TPA: hypothetical protein VM163_12500 [bacterium]|nr:hypothetical protein [bacterium]
MNRAVRLVRGQLWLLAALFVACILGLAGASVGLAQEEPEFVKVDFEVQATPSVVAFFSGNSYGTMTRSSCFDPQLGGFERRRTFVLECVEPRGNALLLDVGNLFNCSGTRQKLKSWAMIAALNIMGYDGLGLGVKDFTFGIRHLKALQRQAWFPFISANVLDAETQEPVFHPFMLFHTTGATVCVSAVVSQDDEALIVDWTKDDEGSRTVEVEQPDEALKRVLASSATIANVVIVLAQMPLDEAIDLSERLPQIDVIVVSDRENTTDLVHGETILVAAGTKSKSLKGLELFCDETGWADRYNIESFPIVEAIEHSSSVVNLHQRFLARRKRLQPEDLRQPTFLVDQSIYAEPQE